MFKVLLVEDEEMIRKGLRHTFDWLQAGCIVIGEAENGEAGLNQIRTLKPDIVIVDVNMPLMDGIAMIERSVEDAVCSYIILSGYDEFGLAKQAIRLGVTEYLLKPLEQEQLIGALERAKRQVEMKKKYELMLSAASGGDEERYASLMKLPSQSSHYVSKMIEYVQGHYADKISINDLVNRLGISSSYLNRIFKSETTYTFNDFVNRYRIQRAMDKLKRGEGKIYTIASEVGFKDYKYFIAIFKKYANCTPGQYQEQFGVHEMDSGK
ncbi:response regulator transcription factor [Paenibacillus beijingensis]|uniref:AraC family transcriptional regulator n=1 Tax=Paenibacillus beijingensis TaxID=1126833 RepID=A0A0D5NK27_9BACL|nr:response regulator [Paenibacillus beijingensis]AJY75357.1 AraC family transcriptional regulator [Paenibacillus beijingensis]